MHPDRALPPVTDSIRGVHDPLLGYDNRTGRPPGRVVAALGRLLPGVARVRGQADPYADTWHARNRALLADPPATRRWVVLGDSLSQGVGATSPDLGLVGVLRDRLARAGHPLAVLNLSATGARVPDVLEQQLPVVERLPAPPAHLAPDLVTVLVGSNDLFGGREHSRALPDAMARLVDRLPDGAVVATLPQPPEAARLANEAIERVVAQGRLQVVDLRTSGPTSWRGRLAADFFHPNDAGYAAMADAFEPVLLEVLDGLDA